ncbi:MAG: tetratricopeptide repeat protein, partial [Anaerolineae bacterium]|nr:tetratricopeptide repeat protein [Anaerolineae bacterium]
LSELNLALGGDWLEAGRESVGLRAGFGLDVTEFQQYLADTPSDLPSLSTAADLYRDNFLTGFTLPNCPEFDEWQFFQSESLRQALASALERLVDLLCDQAGYETAIPYARRRLALDPWHEPAHRHLMRLYAQTGQQAAALRQYQLCLETLAAEFGISPAPETIALHQEIRTGTLSRKADHLEDTPPTTARDPILNHPSKIQKRHNLPPQTTTFVGRERELTNIKKLLLDEAGCRLLNLVGPGGIGKTRLALAAAAQIVEAFPDGAIFVPLAPVSEVADIVPAMAEALRFTFYGSAAPKAQLLDYLSRKKLLLIVDNFEHLVEGADLLSVILSQAPEVTLLATSRERLHLQEEWGYEVQGLHFPAVRSRASRVSDPFEAVDGYSAIELFMQRARQTKANFGPSAEEMADIGRICQLVEGVPLGLELAAPWIRTLSCQEIAIEIERSLDFLSTPLRNVPERHRSLRVVFEQTWGRLSIAEQTVLRQLSVFRGGCTREAAEQVTGATLSVLASLVDKALLRRTNKGRYELHELVRQFAEAQLQTDPEVVNQVQQRHQSYFVAFLETRTAGVKGSKQKATLAEIKADMDNVRLAWRQAVAYRDAEAIERSAECLHIFYTYSSGHYEGQVAFQQAVAAFTNMPDSPKDEVQRQDLIVLDQQENLVGFLLTVQAYFLARISGKQLLPEQVIARLLQAQPGNRRRESVALAFLSRAISYQGRIADSIPYAELGLTLAVETGDLLGEWLSLLMLGGPHIDSQPAKAEQFLKRALAVCQKSGDPSARGWSCKNLGHVSIELGNYREGAQYVEQAIITFGDLDNIQGLGDAFEGAGKLAIAVGDYTGAIQNFRQSLAYFDETRSALRANHCRVWLSMAFRLQGDDHQAEQISQEALATFKAINDPLHRGYCLLNLGCLAQDQGDLARAEQLQQEALNIWQQIEQEARVADASSCLGHLMVASGEQRHNEARKYFRQALELSTKHQVAPIALDVCVGVAQLLAQTEDIEQAVELLALAEHHEATTFETKGRARQLMAELADQWPAEIVQTVQRRGQTQDLWTAAQALLAE